jgi:hypothetical protein
VPSTTASYGTSTGAPVASAKPSTQRIGVVASSEAPRGKSGVGSSQSSPAARRSARLRVRCGVWGASATAYSAASITAEICAEMSSTPLPWWLARVAEFGRTAA